MAEAGLIIKGIMMTAYVQPGGKNSSRRILQRKCEIEKVMVNTLIDEHPDNITDQWLSLSLRRLNQRLLDMGYQDSSPELLRSLLSSLARDGKGFGRSRGSIEFRHSFQDNYRVKLKREWQEITEIMKRPHSLSNAILDVLYDKVLHTDHRLKNVLVEFSSDDLSDAIRKDIALSVEESKILAAIDRGLLFLHEQKAIILQKGLSVFRQAMTIKILPEARTRRYTKGDFEPLSHHYNQRTFQVHVMNEFAIKGADKIKQALGFVMAYFSMDRESFVKKFFSDRKKLLEWATSETSYKNIVDALNNPEQEAIVAGSMNKNSLILAGPGSGKTRVVVHRCAWLLRVRRVPPASILILSFNHSAAVTLKTRLYNLVGNDAKGVAVMTYHALAMPLPCG